MARNRDDFTKATTLKIAKQARWLCCYPPCRAETVGSTSDGEDVINIGTAAHICAAAPGGPRYDPAMSPEDRSSAKNGIWMCRDHGKAIDSTDPEFTVERLREWKRQSEIDSWQRVLRHDAASVPADAANAQSVVVVRAAAAADLKVFQRTTKWPSTSVALTLEVEGFDEPVTTSTLADAVTSLDDLILVAPPGMGKTTTLFQIAEAVLAKGNGTPLVVSLGDWATESTTVLNSILKRPAFHATSEDDFRKAAAQPGVVLLLDGWNELDPEARKRARVQIEVLKAELPELGLIVSTRKQLLDVPFEGTRVNLLPLDEGHQMQIAIALRGDAGARMVDQAWRTAGVRELVTIPLYLTALLSLPENAPFPTTKEEVLRHFVAMHEEEASHAEALHAVAQGFQQDYLDGLAVFATGRSNTSIADNSARQSIFETETLLALNGQITIKPQPDAVLNVLVSNHVLMRTGDTPGYSFQHQQFQEWYASHTVERRIVGEVDDPKGHETLRAEIFNLPAWEEPILFAVERLARGDSRQQAACGKAIIAAFDVDPILAAEMIFRSTEEVWAQVAATIQGLVTRWYAPGTVDRAFRFMLTSGRPEFLDAVWPLITDENDQISLKALRTCRRFRPSILGKDAETKIKALTNHPRAVLLSEMASRSGVDGLNLACAIAKNDPDPELRESVVYVLTFRRADRHVIEVLQNASDKTFDLIARTGHLDQVSDEQVKKGLVAARERQKVNETSISDRLRVLMHSPWGENRSAELTNMIGTMEIDSQRDGASHLIHHGSKRKSNLDAVAAGLLQRLRTGRTLFHGADDILASAKLTLEDDALLELALSDPRRNEPRAEAAASVLGPIAVGRLVDALLDVGARLRVGGQFDSAASEIYGALQSRIAHVPGASLVAAVVARSKQADNDQMARLADLLTRHPNEATDRGRPFDASSIAAIQDLVADWGNRKLASGDATRWHKARIATLASHASSVSLLPILKRVLDDNLERYMSFRKEAEAAGWQHGEALQEARQPLMYEYQRAFLAINAPETTALMQEYLKDEHFGALAAEVLANQWIARNEPPEDKLLFGVNFSCVKERRAARAADTDATSAEAEAIFAAIETLVADGAAEKQIGLAVALGTAASRLPHGQRSHILRKLIDFAPWSARPNLLLNLVLSGAEIDIKDVADGISETLEVAKTQRWILTQSDGYALKLWVRLLPFVGHPTEALAVVRSMPPAQREPRFLEELVGALADAPPAEAEELLFQLAKDPRFYSDERWRGTALRFGTLSSARRMIDLTAGGAFDREAGDDWHLSRELGDLIRTDPDLRSHVNNLLKDGPITRELTMLARAVAESPDEAALLLLVRIEKELKRAVVSERAIEQLVTEHVPASDWEGAYNIMPVPAGSLRQKLLSLTTDGGPADIAARWLRQIDWIRDENGMPETEPRHPDLASGKPWPIMQPDPDANAEG